MAELVESTTLLTWHRVKLIKGSNPFLSAKIKNRDNIPILNFWELVKSDSNPGKGSGNGSFPWRMY